MAELRKSSTKRRSSKTAQVTTHDVKCVVLGDGSVGKSTMLLTYLSGRFPQEVPPGPMDGHAEFDHLTKNPVTIVQDNVEVRLSFVDSYGQDEYEKLRERLCASGDIYLLCFDVCRPQTFERIRHNWLPEMKKYSSPDTPFVMVGLQTDIRTKLQSEVGVDVTKFVTFGDAQREAGELGAAHYVECTAKNWTGVKRVIEKAAYVALQHSLPAELKRSSCVVS